MYNARSNATTLALCFQSDPGNPGSCYDLRRWSYLATKRTLAARSQGWQPGIEMPLPGFGPWIVFPETFSPYQAWRIGTGEYWRGNRKVKTGMFFMFLRQDAVRIAVPVGLSAAGSLFSKRRVCPLGLSARKHVAC